MANQIRFNVGFQVDKTGLNELQNALMQVQNAASKATGTSQIEQDLRAAGQAATQLSDILNQSWNNKLGQLDLSKVNNSIKKTFGSVKDLKTTMEKSGPAGAAAYNQVASSILNTNLQLKQSNKLLDEMAISMANTVKWGITSNIFNNITGSIQKAYGYTKKLDSSLNDIRIVTDKSAESMEKFAIQANQAAKGLGASTLDYTQASLIYYQQGLDDAEVAARAETTLKAANVTGQTGAEVSEQLTAVWNGYKVSAQETELYVDKLAAVAATTAADLEELSTGMSKVASAASVMGVDIDQLNAQLATIVSVTRQAPESVGTALKTIYARMGNIEAGLDTEATLGEITEKMATVGINVLDANGKLRDMGEVIEEVGGKWTGFTREQQVFLSQTMAGTRQYNNLLSLFDNWDMYTDAIKTSSEAAGTLQHQQDIYMESTEAHLQKLSTEAERTYDILFNQDTVNGFTDALTGALGIFNDFLDVTGGGLNSLVTLGSMLGSVFQNQIGASIAQNINNKISTKENEGRAQAAIDTAQAGFSSQVSSEYEKEVYTRQTENAQKLLAISKDISTEKYNELNIIRQQLMENELLVAAIYDYNEEIEKNPKYAKDLSKQLKQQIASTNDIKIVQKDIEKIYKNISNIREAGIKYVEDEYEILNDQSEIINQLSILNDAGLLNDEEKLFTEQAIKDIEEKKVLENEKLLRTQEIINNVLSREIEKEEQLKRLKEAQALIESGEAQSIEQTVAQLERELNAQIENEKRIKETQDLTGFLMDGITIASTFSGMLNTLGDSSISVADKITNLLSATLMLIPSFISIKKNAKGAEAAILRFAASHGVATASGATATGTIVGLTKSIGALTVSTVTFMGITAPLWAILAGGTAIIGALGLAIWGAVKAYNADADAAKKAAEAHKEAAEAAQEAKTAYEELANTMSEYKELADGIKELDESTQEYKDSLEQANEKAMDLIKSNKELAQYAKRNDQGLITFEGNEDKVEEILKEAERKANLAEGAENLAEINANQAQLKSDRTDLIRKEDIGYWIQTNKGAMFQQASNKQLEDVINAINNNWNGSFLVDELKEIESLNNNDELIASIINAQDEIMILAEETKNLNATNELLLDESLRSSLENDADYAAMSEAEKNAVATIYGNEENLTDEIRNTIEQNAENDIKETYSDFAFGWGDEDALHDKYAEKRGWTLSDDKWGDKAVYVDEEGNEHTVEDDSAREYLKNLQVTEALGNYDEELKENLKSAVEKIYDFGETFNTQTASELLGFATKEDQTFDASTMSLETFNQLKGQSAEDIAQSLSGITAEEWDALGYDNAKQYAEAVQKALTPELEAAIKESAKQSIIGLSDDVGTLTKDYQKGDITSENISENEEYQNIVKNLDNIKTLYPELTVAAETFANTNLVGTQMWTESLYELQDAINEIELNDLKEQLTEATDAIYKDKDGKSVTFEAWLESDEFESELDAILNADYAINIEIHSQAEEYFDSTASAIENIKEQAGKIGDSFIVAGEDIRELNNAFPGILEGMENLHDGTVKLNKEVVKSAMDSAKAEVVADSEKTNEKLQNSANELRAKQKTYQAIADAAFALADAEIDSEEETGKYKQTIEEGLSKLNKETADIEMENDASVATNSNENAGILAENWNNAYQKAADSATEFAKVAVSAHKAAEEGNEDLLQKGDFNIVYSGRGGVSSEAKQIEKYQDLFNEGGKENYAKIADAFQAAADAAGKQANDIEGMMKESEIATEGILKGLKGVAAGRGIDDKVDGGDKDKRDEEYKNKDEEIDRYWELNEVIKTIEESISDLDKKQSKLHGKELIASLRQENELLEQQAERYRALAAEQQREASELQGLLSAYGVVFDAQGGVANYLAASQAALDRYNQAVAAYNAFLIDEATFQAEQRAYENFKSLLDRYEALYYEEMRETQNKLDEIHRQELENNLKAWEVEIQLKLDMSEMERQWEDFFKDINENFKLVYEDLDATMENLANKMKTYQGEDGDIATTLQAIKDVQAEIDKMQNGGESDMFESVSQAQEKLKELNEQLQDSALAMKELWEEAWDTYLEGIDQAADQFDDLMEKYDNINEQIEYQKELIELLYGEEAYDLMDKYYETQQKNTMSEIDSLKQQADLWKQQYEEALAIDEANGTISEDTQKFYELWQEAQEELNGKVIDYIDLLQNDYKNAIAGVISDLEKSLTGGSTLDDVKEQWELLQEQADKYYDDVERIYEISNLAGKYETSIANTSELKNQQKLQELYDREMEYLENKKYLTEYDLEVANARYDMALKQIALEEAQQNKNAMKLVRGADGNWSYQYVADEDDIASKQQALLDAANEYYRITKDGYHENLEDMMNAQATYLEKLQEINEIYINDEEMRAQKAQELYEMYYGEGGILTLLYTENEERRTNMADATLQSLTTFYAIDEENYTRMTEVERELIDGLKDGTLDNYDEMLEKAKEVCGETLDAWTSSAQEIANQWYKDGGDSVKAQIIQAYKDMELANKSYQDAVAALEKAVEQNFGEEGITGALNDAQKETEELDDKTEELCDNAESNLDRYRDAVNQIGEAWEAVKDQIQDAINLVNEYLNLVGSGGSDSSGGSGDPGSGGGTSPSPGSGGGSGDGQLSVGETVTYTGGLYYYDSNGTAPSGSRGPGKQVKVTQIASGKPYPIHVQSNDSAYGWLKKEQLSGYDTGGYTGDWHGGDGRLALLHSKELVLNANDTENMLAAVNTVRQIANLGDSINQSIMNGISQMILGLTGLGNYGNYSIGETKESGDTIFEIQANFPNANDVESIREAIMSLPNLASQYIARNKK